MTKKLFLISATIATMIFAACGNSTKNVEPAITSDTSKTAQVDTTQVFNLDTNKLASGATFYQCEMHPAVISDKPGSCPECGMDLSAIIKK